MTHLVQLCCEKCGDIYHEVDDPRIHRWRTICSSCRPLEVDLRPDFKYKRRQWTYERVRDAGL